MMKIEKGFKVNDSSSLELHKCSSNSEILAFWSQNSHAIIWPLKGPQKHVIPVRKWGKKVIQSICLTWWHEDPYCASYSLTHFRRGVGIDLKCLLSQLFHPSRWLLIAADVCKALSFSHWISTSLVNGMTREN